MNSKRKKNGLLTSTALKQTIIKWQLVGVSLRAQLSNVYWRDIVLAFPALHFTVLIAFVFILQPSYGPYPEMLLAAAAHYSDISLVIYASWSSHAIFHLWLYYYENILLLAHKLWSPCNFSWKQYSLFASHSCFFEVTTHIKKNLVYPNHFTLLLRFLKQRSTLSGNT